MIIRVTRIYKPHIAKLKRRGWKQAKLSKLETGSLPPKRFRELNGDVLQKNFKGTLKTAMRAAMFEFERVTGADVISDTDQCGCSVHTFLCPGSKIVISGWGCGFWMFDLWAVTPRKCLEALNG